jgi:23S rRNA pseudouridine1911/1915/1917 synthase
LYHFRNLSERGGAERAGIVHRLDKNTTGLLLVAKDDQIHTKLQEALQKREIKRNYTALICGHVKESGEIDAPIGRSSKDRKKMAVTNRASREAQTSYQLIDRFRTYDLLDVSLQTGRTHQIRVHLAHIGHPVFGDPEYGGRDKWHKGIFANEKKSAKELLEMMPYQALHSTKIEFVHPVKGAKVIVQSELPPNFKSLLEKLDQNFR